MTPEELKNKRIDAGLTQAQVAEAAGVSQPSYARFERNIKHTTTPETVARYNAAIEAAVQSNPTKPSRSPSKQPDRNHYEVASTNTSSPTFAIDWVRPRSGRDLYQFDEIARRNPHVKQVLELLANMAFWVKASVKPDPANDYTTHPHFEQRDEILIDLVTRMFKGFIENGPDFRETLKAWFKAGTKTGMAIALKVWSRKGRFWWLDTLKQKPSWDFSPITDEWGNLVGMWHYPSAGFSRDRTVPGWDSLFGYNPDRFFYAPWPGLENENYLGISEVEAILTEVLKLEKNEKAQQRWIKKRSMSPMMHIREDRNAKVIDKKVDELESNDVIHLPGMVNEAGDITPSSVIKGVETSIHDRLLDSLESSMDRDIKTIGRSMGKPDLLGTTETAAGSWALGRVQFDAFLAVGDNAHNWIDANVTRLIRQIAWYNFPDWVNDPEYCLPIYQHDELDEEVQARMADVWLRELEANALTRDEYREFRGYGPMPEQGETGAEEEVES